MYLVYVLFYLVINQITDFSYNYNNGFEYLIGAFVVALVMYLIEKLIYKVAYDYTGVLYKISIIDGSYEGKNVHWFIRAILMAIVFLISLTPIPSMLITPISHDIYLYLQEQLTITSNELTEIFTSNILKQAH